MAFAHVFRQADAVAVSPLSLAQGILRLSGVQVTIQGQERVPTTMPLVLVSNHRSLLDAFLLMQAVNRSVRFACHHYMSQVPGLREATHALGCLPLDAPGRGQTAFFRRAIEALAEGESVGIFPEGAAPMVQTPQPDRLTPFHRGFAHLALRAPVEELAILPVAIASRREVNNPLIPLRLLSWFDANEPLFQQPGLHPAVMYREVSVVIGHPVRVDARLRSHYRRRGTNALIQDLTGCCQEEIATLLRHP